MKIILDEPSFNSVGLFTGRNYDLSNEFLPFTCQDSFEYFEKLYNDSVSDLLSYHHDEPRPYHREYDSKHDPINNGAASAFLVIQQEYLSDYQVQNGYSNSPSRSSSGSSRDTESTSPFTAPSASTIPQNAEQSQAAFQNHGTVRQPCLDAFKCSQCHKVFAKKSILR
jgi:hypothetical protein